MDTDGTLMSHDENRENSDSFSTGAQFRTPLRAPLIGAVTGCRPYQNAMNISSRATQLRTSCGEELARLANIARDLHCFAVIRGLDGVLLPLSPANCAAGAETRGVLSVPVYDAEGILFAQIELSPERIDQSSFAHKLLQAVAEPLARSLCERLFRIRYCQHWIVAAQCADNSRKCMLLAMDRNGHLVGADRCARGILNDRCMDLKGLELSRLFQVPSEILYRARFHEVSLKLVATSDGAPWFVLITPPRFGAVGTDIPAQLHSRPRLESITSSSASLSDTSEHFGLPSHMVRRIEEFVGARLESGIQIEDLARCFDYSLAHFFRMFKRSFGITPHTYIMRRRLALAQDLIARTELTLLEVAMKAGFADQSHLCRSFRRFAGLAPRAFRMQYRGIDEARHRCAN